MKGVKNQKLKKTRSSQVLTWEQIVRNEKQMLVKAWTAKNPQKSFSDKIQKLHRKYTKNAGNTKTAGKH